MAVSKRAVLLALTALYLAIPAVLESRPFTSRDMALLERVSAPQLSPDGRWVAYSLRSTDWEGNKGIETLWLASAADPAVVPRRLAISDGGTSSPRWSADGHIYFLSARSQSNQVWRTDIAGRTAQQVTNLPLDVGSFKLAPDNATLILSLAVFPDCGANEISCTAERLKAKGERKASGSLVTEGFVRHWNEWSDGTRNHLFRLALNRDGKAIAEPVPLTTGFSGDVPTMPFGDAQDYSLAPDGTLIFTARAGGREEPWSTNFDLWRVPASGSPPQNLTASNPAADIAPSLSPDGRRLAYLATRRPGHEADRNRVMLRDLTTGAEREVAAGWDRSSDKIRWSKDGMTLLATALDMGQTRLFAIDVENGSVAPLTGDGNVSDFDVAAAGIVYVQDNFTAPAQLFALRLDGSASPMRLTHHNSERLADVEFGKVERFSFKGWGGDTVYGYLVYPVGFQPGRKYPVAFLLHGGPQSSYSNRFTYRWNPQTFAGRGYAAVMIDFHGSIGYGQAFSDAVREHWGDRPLEDLQKGWAHVLGQYPFLNGDRACALGGSYGGYMVNWIAGNWSRPWKCLVNHAGIFDLRAMAQATDEPYFMEWEFGGALPKREGAYDRFNPARLVPNWRTPMLVTHGGRDFRVPETQGLATYAELQRRGIPSGYLYFPDEGHWIQKPQNLVQWQDIVEAWLDRWTAAEPDRR